MTLEWLERREAEINAHALAQIKAMREQKRNRREARAMECEILSERDDLRGEMLRQFLSK
jgi:hypothetical protein